MRKLSAALLGCLVLAGCAASWQDEVLCVVEQKKGGAFEDSNVVTNVKSCKKA